MKRDTYAIVHVENNEDLLVIFEDFKAMKHGESRRILRYNEHFLIIKEKVEENESCCA